MHDRWHLQGNAAVLLQGLGVLQVAQQATEGLQGQGVLRQAEAIEAAEAVVLLQGALRLHWAEGGAGHWREPQPFRAPGRPLSIEGGGPEQFGGLLLGQLLVQGAAVFPLHHLHLAGAHIGAGQAPAQRLFSLGRLHHHSRQPVVAAGAEHALLQHGAGGQHPGDVPLEQGTLGGGGLELIAKGHAVALLDQFGAVALGGVVGDARHRHPPDRLAAFLTGEGELQHPGEFDGIFEEALEEVAQAVEQHPFGMGRFELHVVAQHRCELQRVQLAVVGPGRFVAAGF